MIPNFSRYVQLQPEAAREELEYLFTIHHTTGAVARAVGVSERTVFNWTRVLGVEFERSHGGRQARPKPSSTESVGSVILQGVGRIPLRSS